MIGRVLVANRGEIARRVFRTCRDMRIETVAVYADPDQGEPHRLEADQAVRLPGSSPAETYLDMEAIVSAAIESGADAIHPGYGFLSESAAFASAVAATNLIWIGPPAQAIATMGSKLESKSLAESAGVPVLSSIDLTGLAADAVGDAADQIGYPVLVKASAGGGGKGMRIVRSPSGLTEAVAGSRREAGAAFGDDTVFLESYLDAPRHIEIQLVADHHGNIASLYERECSIQRRHQKIIEEAPSTAIDSSARQQMSEAAVSLARAVGYSGVGTVEFLFHAGQFWFLEMNTRLQVEHPVTEMITGIDLVRLQIEIADGGSLDRHSLDPAIEGHAIEARLYAEDPAHDYLPVTGTVHQFSIPAAEGLRVDSGIENGSKVSTHFDPMLAKLIAHAPTRRQAASVLAGALRQARIHGPTTNRDLLVRILEDGDFLDGRIDTHFLEDRDLTMPLVDEEAVRSAAIAVAIADRSHRRQESPVLPSLRGGWRNAPSSNQRSTYLHGATELAVDYLVIRGRVSVTGVEVASATPEDVVLVVDGEAQEFSVHRVGAQRFVDGPSGSVTLEEVPRFKSTTPDEAPGSLHAPMPGRVVRVEVVVGDMVTEGQILMVLEAMKMEHTLRAPVPGTVQTVNASSGQQVDAGTVLVVVDELSPST